MRRTLTGLMAGALLIGAAAGAGAQQAGGKPQDVANVVKGNDAFAFDLYGQLAKKDGNLFFSPYSISTALAMTYGGARGQTAVDMAKTLHFTLSPDELHAAYGKLRHQINDGKDRKYQLYTVNRLWGQRDYQFQPAFLNLTRDHYGAGLEEVDFVGARAQARKTINDWVAKQTQDKIKDLVPAKALSVDTRLVLTNAIYFKAAWSRIFHDGATQKGKFHLNGKDTVTAPFMHKDEHLPYFANDQFQAVSVPYENGQLNLVVLLPRSANGLRDLEKQLSAARLAEWRGKMKWTNVRLALPKFKFTSTFNLNEVLSDLGMANAFSDKADFSGMTTQNKLHISNVIHKAFIDVHEKGTEAAAATAVVMDKEASAVQPTPPQPFRADRPFVFLIQEARTGSILFAGRVANPVAE